MKLSGDATLLRVFISETDKYRGKPLYEQIVLEARRLNVAGATVLRGVMGYGAASRIHTAKVLNLSQDLPLVVEVVDTREKLAGLLAFLNEAVGEGLVTLEKVQVIQYRHGQG